MSKRAAETQLDEQQAKVGGSKPHSATVESGNLRAVVTVMDGGSLPGGIVTGICFLNHMIDQLTAHGQLAIAAQVSLDGVPFTATADYTGSADPDPASAPRPHDDTIFRIVGAALGECLGKVLGPEAAAGAVRFCSPLDEGMRTMLQPLPTAVCRSIQRSVDRARRRLQARVRPCPVRRVPCGALSE